MKEELAKRLETLEKEIHQSMANHNALMGRLFELREIIKIHEETLVDKESIEA